MDLQHVFFSSLMCFIFSYVELVILTYLHFIYQHLIISLSNISQVSVTVRHVALALLVFSHFSSINFFFIENYNTKRHSVGMYKTTSNSLYVMSFKAYDYLIV